MLRELLSGRTIAIEGKNYKGGDKKTGFVPQELIDKYGVSENHFKPVEPKKKPENKKP